MPNLKNDRLIKALFRQPVDRTPVWMMRQAGRYLPEYRQLRKEAKNFLSLCKNPAWACEVTLQPLARFPLDAAIIFSDILTIPDAMELGLYFEEGEGPKFERPLNTLEAIEKLTKVDSSKLSYVYDAIKLTSTQLNASVPLIGFCGSPWTIACYMVEGGSSKAYTKIKSLLYKNPEHLHHILNCLTDSLIDYLKEQAKAGANALMVFDTWGGVLSQEAYLNFSLPYMQKIVDAIAAFDQNIPVILFTKNGGAWLEQMANTGCHALGVDWTTQLSVAKAKVGHKVALQGNLDPSVLYASHDVIKQEVKKVLDSFGGGPGHVFNLGHGIHPDVPYENVEYFINIVHELSPAYNRT